MKNYLKILTENYLSRRSKAEKEAFRTFVEKECQAHDVPCQVDVADGNHNIVIGDISRADVIFTAHYDTPARSFYPNLLVPTNRLFRLFYHLTIPVLMALISLLASYYLEKWLGFGNIGLLWTYLLLYFGTFFVLTRAFPNKNNYNDNTSGVATILELAMSGQGYACVLFDNEEKGLLGSKAFAKKYSDQMAEKTILNFDCVGDGRHFIFVYKPTVEQGEVHQALAHGFTNTDAFSVHFYSSKKASCKSDQKNFPCSIGVVACHKVRGIGYCAARIHTNRDVICQSENIEFLVSNVLKSFPLDR